MEAKELRIGNYIERDGNILEAVRIAKDGIINYDLVKKSEGMHVNSGNVIPIQLTNEWLFKLGFKKVREDYFSIDKDKYHTISLAIVNNFYMPFIRSNHHEAGENFSFYGIKHVHQLQNLYFALTGCELEIK